MERNESNIVWEQHGGNVMESFYDNITVGSQIAAHTLMETGNGPNEPNTINL